MKYSNVIRRKAEIAMLERLFILRIFVFVSIVAYLLIIKFLVI